MHINYQNVLYQSLFVYFTDAKTINRLIINNY